MTTTSGDKLKEFQQDTIINPDEILNTAVACLNNILDDFCENAINRKQFIVKKKKVHLRYKPPNPVWISGINIQLQSVYGLAKHEVELVIKQYKEVLEKEIIAFIIDRQISRLADTFFINIDIDNFRYNHNQFQEVS